MSIPIFVINLERSTDRRKKILDMMNSYNLSYEIFPAIDGYALSDQIVQKYGENSTLLKKARKYPLTKGEIGCALSHLGVYQRIVDCNIRHAIILEDDAILSPLLASFVKSHEIEALSDAGICDLILLVYRNLDVREFHIPACLKFRNRIHLNDIDGNKFFIGRPARRYISAVGYFISQRGARILMENGHPVRMPADILTSTSERFNVKMYITHIPIVTPDCLDYYESKIGIRGRRDLTYKFVQKTKKLLGLTNESTLFQLVKHLVFQTRRIFLFFWQIGLFDYPKPKY